MFNIDNRKIDEVKRLYNKNKKKVKFYIKIAILLVILFLAGQFLYYIYILHQSNFKSIDIKEISIDDQSENFIKTRVLVNNFNLPLDVFLKDILIEIMHNDKSLVELEIKDFEMKKGKKLYLENFITIKNIKGNLFELVKATILELKIYCKAGIKVFPFYIPIRHKEKVNINLCKKDPQIESGYIKDKNYITKLKLDIPDYVKINMSEINLIISILNVNFKIIIESLNNEYTDISVVKIITNECTGVPDINSFFKNETIDIKIKECSSESLCKNQIEKIFKNQIITFRNIKSKEFSTRTSIKIIKDKIILKSMIKDNFIKNILKNIEFPIIKIIIKEYENKNESLVEAIIKKDENILTEINIKNIQKIIDGLLQHKNFIINFNSLFKFMDNMYIRFNKDKIESNFINFSYGKTKIKKIHINHTVKEEENLIDIISTNKKEHIFIENDKDFKKIEIKQMGYNFTFNMENIDIKINFNNFTFKILVDEFSIKFSKEIKLEDFNVRTKIIRNNVIFKDTKQTKDDFITDNPNIFIYFENNIFFLPTSPVKNYLEFLNHINLKYEQPLNINKFDIKVSSQGEKDSIISNEFIIPSICIILSTGIKGENNFKDFIEIETKEFNFSLNYKNKITADINDNILITIHNIPVSLDLLIFKPNGGILSELVANILNILPLNLKGKTNNDSNFMVIINYNKDNYNIKLHLPEGSFSKNGLLSPKFEYPNISFKIEGFGITANVKIKESWFSLVNLSNRTSKGIQPNIFLDMDIEFSGHFNLESVVTDNKKPLKIYYQNFEKILELTKKDVINLKLNSLEETGNLKEVKFDVNLILANNLNKYLFLFFKFIQIEYTSNICNIKMNNISISEDIIGYRISLMPHTVALYDIGLFLDINMLGMVKVENVSEDLEKSDFKKIINLLSFERSKIKIKLPYVNRISIKPYILILFYEKSSRRFSLTGGNKIVLKNISQENVSQINDSVICIMDEDKKILEVKNILSSHYDKIIKILIDFPYLSNAIKYFCIGLFGGLRFFQSNR